MKLWNFILVFSRVAVILLAAGHLLLAGEFNRVMNIGDPLPRSGNLPAVGGTTLFLDDIDEEVLVLAFLANHCPWVQGVDDDLIKLVDEMAGKSVRVVGISVNHRKEDRLPAMEEYSSKVGYNFTYAFDESQDLGRKLGASRTPTFFVFDSRRHLVYTGLFHNSPAQMRRNGSVHYTKGEPTQLYVKEAIAAALEDRAAPVAETRAHGCNIAYVR